MPSRVTPPTVVVSVAVLSPVAVACSGSGALVCSPIGTAVTSAVSSSVMMMSVLVGGGQR